MSSHVPRYVFLDTAPLCYDLNAVLAVGIARYRQQFSILGHALVFLDDMLRNVQQSDICFDTRFLTVGVQP